MASAIAPGSFALAIAEFIRTPSAPSSMAIVASDGVPTPASTIRGTSVIISLRIRMFATFWMPIPEPIGAPRGIIGVVARRGIRQDHDLLAIDEIQERLSLRGFEVDAANGHRHHVRARTPM